MSAARSGRVVTTSSRAGGSGRLDPGDLSRERRRWSAWLQYGDTKQANALFTLSLAERGAAATCFHPGVIRTEFAAETLFMKLTALPGVAEPVERAGARLAHLASHEDGVTHAGSYFKRNKPVKAPAGMRDPELARALWAASERATEEFR